VLAGLEFIKLFWFDIGGLAKDFKKSFTAAALVVEDDVVFVGQRLQAEEIAVIQARTAMHDYDGRNGPLAKSLSMEGHAIQRDGGN